MLRPTARVALSITLTVPARLFVTHASPTGAIAIERGAAPTANSASFWLLDRSNALTESLSGLTTQSRPEPIARVLEDAGRNAVIGACITCEKVWVCSVPRSSLAVTVTQ